MLSICIPTWNRWYCIGHIIDGLIKQKAFHSWKVELVIVDNASSDNTETIVKTYQTKHKNIRYYRNKTNIWAMPNISKSLSLWNGEYIRWLWSDDAILEWGIQKTLDLIESKNPSIIIHSYEHENLYKPLIKKGNSLLSKENVLSFKNQTEYLNYLWDQYIYDKNSFAVSLKHNLSVFSIWCIRKTTYNILKQKIIDDKWQNFFDYFNFIHVLNLHYDNTDGSILMVLDNFLRGWVWKDTNPELSKKSTWRPGFSISNDACYTYNYLYKKYDLNRNFRKLRNKNNVYRTLGAIMSLWFIIKVRNMLDRIWFLSKIENFILKF